MTIVIFIKIIIMVNMIIMIMMITVHMMMGITWPGTVATILMSGSAEVLALGLEPDLKLGFDKIQFVRDLKMCLQIWPDGICRR